jgi:Fuc2NAc and GlcNAc transferase
VIATVGAWLIVHWGHQFGLSDVPNERSSHRIVTPRGGGIGILAAFVIVSMALNILKSFWIPAAMLSLLSFWGDEFDISPIFRLFIQFMASIILLLGIFKYKEIQITGYFLIIPLTVFIAGTSNFYNFMDGIDGIAGITGVVGFGLLAYFAFLSEADPHIVSLNICISLSCLGFLTYNIPKAKVFMGDVGSVLLGFIFAGMVVWLSKDLLDFVVLITFLFPFYADEFTTIMVRLRDGENLIRPHRRHLYQLLANELKIAHWKVSVGYGCFQLLIGTSIIIIKNVNIMTILSMLTVYFCGFTGLSLILRKRLLCY